MSKFNVLKLGLNSKTKSDTKNGMAAFLMPRQAYSCYSSLNNILQPHCKLPEMTKIQVHDAL